MQTTAVVNTFIGVDVSKDWLVSCIHGSEAAHSIANQRNAIEAWLARLPSASAIAMEATASYHELLADLAHSRGLPVYVLNPKDLRGYAKGVGVRTKTDRVDATVIARYLAREHSLLHGYIAPSPQQRQLQRLLGRRAKLTRSRSGVKQSLQGLAGLSRALNQLLKRFDALLAAIDLRITGLINACPKRQAAQLRLRSIKGVGPVVAPALLNPLERFRFRSADSFVAYTGYDLRADDSGKRHGRRRLSKHGHAELRRLLYIAAMAAVKSTAWKPSYEHYLAKGLSRTAALVVIARKIARTAWSIYTHNTTFDPNRITHQT